MRKLEKLTISECTIPVGNECIVPSLLEAEAIMQQTSVKYKKIKLMHLITSFEEDTLQWCAMPNSKDISAIVPVFENDYQIRGIPIKAKELEIGEYIRHKNNYYTLCKDSDYKQIIKQISIFANYDDILSVYKLSEEEFISQSELNIPPEIYLVRITKVDKPKETLCISWFIDKEEFPPFFPVFAEDIKVFKENNFNTLNWEFMKVGDTFTREGTTYQICSENEEEYYIAKLPKPIFRIIKSESD